MMAPMAREKILSVVLTLLALLLGGLLYWEWNEGLQLEQVLTRFRKIPVTPVPGQEILPEFALPDAQTGFPELISRSMFTVGRRSTASGSKGGASLMKKGQFVLVGVLITPSQRSALLRDVQTNKTETVALVGQVRGMTLSEVEPSRVVLRQGAESEELVLNVQIGPKGPGAPPAQPTQPTPPVPLIQPALVASAASGAVRAGPPIPVASAAVSAPGKPIEPVSGPKPLSAPPPLAGKK
jgi:hypothetical protein